MKTHNSDEVRRPEGARKSIPTADRRLARGYPAVAESADSWPRAKAANRPSASFSGGEPHAGPDKRPWTVVVLQSDLSALVRNRQSQQLTRSPPVSVVNRPNGGSASAPELPSRALGLQQDQLKPLFGADD